MKLEQLSYFMTVVQDKSINTASEELHISPQALSRSMRMLEKEIEITLFERSRHGVMLTALGERFYKLVTYFFDELQEMQSATTEQYRFQSPLAILSCWGIEGFLPDFLSQLYLADPSMILNSTYSNYHDVVAKVDEGVFDIGFLNMTFIEGRNIFEFDEDKFIFVPLSVYKYCCIVSQKSPLATYKTISCKSLLNYTLIAVGKYVEYSNSNIIFQFGTPKKIIWNENYYMMMQLVKENLGYSLSSLPYNEKIPEVSDEIVSIKLKEEIITKCGYIIKKDTVLSENTIMLIHFLNQHYKTEQA